VSALGFLAMISFKVSLIVSRFALVISLIGVFSTISHGNERFISGFEDLPLMRGMTETTESNVAFDTVHGRVLVSFAQSSESKEKILTFYKESLSQLGWKINSDGEFFRGEEILKIDFLPDGDDVAIRFSLEPR
tara:strand:- start:2492 stop:2893 length:402 start_codon:yes stop_codon:yes gene_type:complete